jgi:hypothetical protein
VLAAATLTDGIKVAFRVDAVLAVIGLGVCLAFVHGPKRSAAHAASPLAHHRVRALPSDGASQSRAAPVICPGPHSGMTSRHRLRPLTAMGNGEGAW